MEYRYIILFILILFLIGCVQQPTIPAEPTKPIEEPAKEPEKICTEMWICQDEKIRVYRKSDCTVEEAIECEAGCENGECKEVIKEEEKQEEAKEEPQPQQEKPELSEQEQIQQIFGYAKTKIKNYYYKYKSPSGIQYLIYVKENKIRIGSLSNDDKIYIDTEKKTAEKWCISHVKCGKQIGKIADLDYYDAYINTPIDWLAKITEAKKIDDGYYYGKKGWVLDTNIGEVTIDSNFGFIYSIKQKDKTYVFSDASFNTVEDSDVNVPEYLLPK